MAEIEHATSEERRLTKVAHRTGITVFTAVLFAAFVGLLGRGPLSHATASSTDGNLHVDYCRFVRYEAPERLDIRLAAEFINAGEVQLQLSKEFVEQVEMQSIEPEPTSTASGSEHFTYTVRLDKNRPGSIRVRFTPHHFGRLKFQVGVAAGPTVHAQHFAYP
jgi:hypothetical protein